MNSVKQYKEIKGVLALAVCFIPLFMDSTAWLGILISDSDSWDGQNLEFRFRVWDSGTFRRKIKSENMKTVQVENQNSGPHFSGFRNSVIYIHRNLVLLFTHPLPAKMWWWADECAPAWPRLHCSRNFLTASAIAQLILLEARPDNHGIDGTGLDNSRLSGFPPMRWNKNHAWNCLVTNDVIRKDWKGFTRSYPAVPAD